MIEQATRLRASYGLKTPDALQAACALQSPGKTLFVTADTGFANVPGLELHLIQRG